MKFLGLCLALLPLTNAFLLSPRKSYERTQTSMASHENMSISVINVSNDNIQILEKSEKFAFIKLENISNRNMEDVFFRSISLLDENGVILVDLQKYQNHLLRAMIDQNCVYDFSQADMNKNTFFWTKKLN